MERIRVDFNEMLDEDIVMLSQTDTKKDALGRTVTFYEGMPVSVYEEDIYEDGEIDFLVAEGVAVRHDLEVYPSFPHVKWLCRIDAGGVQNRPELRAAEQGTEG